MKQRAIILSLTIGSLASAGLALLLTRTQPSSLPIDAHHIATLASLPASIKVEGEVMRDGTLSTLDVRAENNERLIYAKSAPQSLILRLIDTEQNKFYDVTIARQINFEGFAPQTRVSLRTEKSTLENDVPMDWNGRMTLKTPRGTPLHLSVSHDDQSFTLELLTPIGGAA